MASEEENNVLGKALAGGFVALTLAATAWAQIAPDAARPNAPNLTPSKPGSTMTPVQRVESAPQGTLKDAYTDDNADIVEQGHKLFFNYWSHWAASRCKPRATHARAMKTWSRPCRRSAASFRPRTTCGK